MKPDEYVYCVRCKNFEPNTHFDFDDISTDVCPANCAFEEGCYFYDWEDGRRYELRKHYEPKE